MKLTMFMLSMDLNTFVLVNFKHTPFTFVYLYVYICPPFWLPEGKGIYLRGAMVWWLQFDIHGISKGNRSAATLLPSLQSPALQATRRSPPVPARLKAVNAGELVQACWKGVVATLSLRWHPSSEFRRWAANTSPLPPPFFPGLAPWALPSLAHPESERGQIPGCLLTQRPFVGPKAEVCIAHPM